MSREIWNRESPRSQSVYSGWATSSLPTFHHCPYIIAC